MLTSEIELNPNVTDVLRCAQGARKTSSQRRTNDALVSEYNGLEPHEIHERWEVIDILRRIKSVIGINDSLINHIDYIMKRIPVREWEQGGCPIFYQSVVNQKDELGISSRAIRYRESKLADLGFLAFHDSSNGRRYPVKPNGQLATAYGVSLIPLMMRVDELRQIDYEYRQIIQKKRQLRNQVAAKKRQIAILIDEVLLNLDGHEAQCVEWADKRNSIGSVRADNNLRKLGENLKAYSDLEAEIRTILFEYDAQNDQAQMCENGGKTQKISAPQEKDFRHIYTNTENNNSKGYYCNTGENKSVDSSAPVMAIEPVDVCREEKGKTKVPTSTFSPEAASEVYSTGSEFLSPSQIYEASCRDFRVAIDTVTDHAFSKDLTINDIRLAGEYLVSHVAISPHAWATACRLLGRYGASIGLMLSVRPHIKNAGAYLNGLLLKHREGKLHLHRSVFAQSWSGNMAEMQ